MSWLPVVAVAQEMHSGGVAAGRGGGLVAWSGAWRRCTSLRSALMMAAHQVSLVLCCDQACHEAFERLGHVAKGWQRGGGARGGIPFRRCHTKR